VVFSGYSVSFINKSDCHDISEIFLKVALNTTKQTNNELTLEFLVKKRCFSFFLYILENQYDMEDAVFEKTESVLEQNSMENLFYSFGNDHP
jgi:hypothetical protein